MKTKNILIVLFAALAFPAGAFALSAPTADAVPSSINADTYTLKIYTEQGAKVTVVGGPSDLAPVTDGESGDALDGVVQIMVGLAQDADNVFSVVAEKGGEISSSITVTIHETATAGTGQQDAALQETAQKGIVLPPAPPLKRTPAFSDAAEYIIWGKTEPNANIYIRDPDGVRVGSGHADEKGIFGIKVPLAPKKTNYFSVSAELDPGHEGPASSIVIRRTTEYAEPEEEKKSDKATTSAQVFFSDVEGHWAATYVEQLSKFGVVSGKGENHFDPNAPITRAELVKIAIMAFGYSTDTTINEHPFSDVPKNSWFASFVAEAKRAGIVEGVQTGGFLPNTPITRAEALKILLKAAGTDLVEGGAGFTDVSADAWFAPYVATAKAAGIIGGYEDGTFRPGASITRAEVAKIVVKIMELK